MAIKFSEELIVISIYIQCFCSCNSRTGNDTDVYYSDYNAKKRLIEYIGNAEDSNIHLAKKLLDSLIKFYDVDPVYRNIRAWKNLELKEYKAAIEDFTYMINEVDSKYLVNRSSAYAEMGQINSAQKDMELFLAYKKDTGNYYFVTGRIFYQVQLYDSALYYLNKAKKYPLYHSMSLVEEARVYASTSNLNKACDILNSIDHKSINKNVQQEVLRMKSDIDCE